MNESLEHVGAQRDDAARISVYRQDDSRQDRSAMYRVVIDGVPAGDVAAGGCKTFEVPVGTHAVHMRYGWLGSNTVTVTAVVDQEIKLLCSRSGWVSRLAYGLISSNHYLRLRQLAAEDHKLLADAPRPRARVARDLRPGLLGT